MAVAPENSVHALSRDEWRQWLEQYHMQPTGVWLVTYKKASGKPRVTYDEAVEEALCFGWIDSKPGKLDDERSMHWFAPRKPGTGWSRLNKQRIAALTEAGKMTPAGLAKVAAAQQDGSWNALDAVEALEIPADLQQKFVLSPQAQAHFEAFPRTAKRAILEWIAGAKKPETRAKRIAETVELAAQNKRARSG